MDYHKLCESDRKKVYDIFNKYRIELSEYIIEEQKKREIELFKHIVSEYNMFGEISEYSERTSPSLSVFRRPNAAELLVIEETNKKFKSETPKERGAAVDLLNRKTEEKKE
jgi:hypothetical protein